MHSMRLRLFYPTTVSSIVFLMFFPVLCSAQEQEENVSSFPVSWGLKTNMVYNTLSFVNIGIEGNVGKHFGFEAEAICPWWDAPDHHKTAKMLNLGLEGRYYWKGWEDTKSILTGPYVSVHANGGIYDICYQNHGVRGDYFVLAGVGIGYTYHVEDNWRINLGVGFGMIYSPYEHYHVLDKEPYYDLLVNHYQGKYTYFVPTKIEFSVVWLLGQQLSK